MKTIALEQLDQRIAEALTHQRSEDPILLTKGQDALGLLLRLPTGAKDWDVDQAVWLDQPTGRVLVIIEAKHGQPLGSESGTGGPVFGSCKGMITIVAEDDEHLKDFEEYMK
jgi:hypothetical protein